MTNIWFRGLLVVKAFILCFIGVAGSANAAQFGLPRVIYDSREGSGQNIYTTQGIHFNADIGFAVSAKALAITYDGINFIPLVNGTVDFHASFIGSSSESGVVTGKFTGVGGSLPDLIVAENGVLLLGTNYWDRKIVADFGASSASTDSRYTVVSGSLASYYSQSDWIGANFGSLVNVGPSFSSTSFSNNFDGDIFGAIAPVVPEPSAITLFCLGSVILARNARQANNRVKSAI